MKGVDSTPFVPSVLVMRRTLPEGWNDEGTVIVMPLTTPEERAATLLHVLRSWADDGNAFPVMGDPPFAPELTDEQIAQLPPKGRVREAAEKDRRDAIRAFDAYTYEVNVREHMQLALDKADAETALHLLTLHQARAGLDSIHVLPLTSTYTWWKLT